MTPIFFVEIKINAIICLTENKLSLYQQNKLSRSYIKINYEMPLFCY